MIEKLIELEKQLVGYSERSNLNEESLLLFPENVRQIHSYKVFGDDLLAIPAGLIIEGDDGEFEKPFSFLDSIGTIEIFESEFRSEIPHDFIQIGNVYGSTEIVLLNKTKNSVHIFHVSDIADSKWLKYKLQKEICDLATFVQNLRPQTVCCLIDPNNYSKWDIFEIRNNCELMNDVELIKYPDHETAWNEYRKLVDESLAKGYQFHYGPKRIKDELKIK
jgi:hypothetical protein